VGRIGGLVAQKVSRRRCFWSVAFDNFNSSGRAMKTHRTTKKADQAKRGTSKARQAAGSVRRAGRRNTSLSPGQIRSGHPSISLRFKVKRPPSENGPNASNESSSRFRAAYTVFRQRHPNSVPLTGRQVPPKDCSPLEYVEWAIWKARERWSDATWDNWFLGFYEKLVKSESLKEVCQDQCKATDAAYALLGLLLWDADRFESHKTPRKHGGDRGAQSIREEQVGEALSSTSVPDLKQLLKIQEIVKGLRFDYTLQVNEERTPATNHEQYHHQKTLADIIHGFLQAVAEEDEVRAQVDSDTPAQGIGRPEAGVTSRDMFCALVSHFVQEAFRGEDHSGPTISIIQDFAPGLLKDSRSSDSMKATKTFAQRLKAFRKKGGAIKEFNKLVATYKTHRSFPSIMKTFQPE